MSTNVVHRSSSRPWRAVVLAAAVACSSGAAPALSVAATKPAKPSPAERTLTQMAAAGTLDAATAKTDIWLLRDSRARARRLLPAARAALTGAADVADSLAKRGQLAGAVTPVFLDLAASRTWLGVQHRPVPALGARTTFGTSPIVYSYRPEAGWQIHPLANWGAINGILAGGPKRLPAVKAYVDAMLQVAVRRAGALTWEYFFPYAGGAPGWVSAMPTATSLPALQAVYAATGDPRYGEAIDGALSILSWPAPTGTNVAFGPGKASFLLYSQTPDVLVGNAITAVLLGLNDYITAAPAGDPRRARAQQLLDAGVAQWRTFAPLYDTGTWSWYALDRNGRGLERSDLHYHDFFGYELRRACKRFGEPFCAEGKRFPGYESLPPGLGVAQLAVRRGDLAFDVAASAEATGRVSLWRGGRVVLIRSARLRAGANRLTLPRPSGTGQVRVKVEVTAMDGTSPESADATAQLPKPKKKPPAASG